MAIELRRSSEFPLGELATLFTAAYRDYFVPFAVDEPTLAYMVDAFDLRLSHSLVAVESGTAVGLANLGRRGERSWVGGIGVVPARRGAGIGRRLMQGLLDRARGLGAREMVLEVIAENAPAIALYEKLGFRTIRELEVLSLERADADGDAEGVEVGEAQRLIAAMREGPEPWQRDDLTVANLLRRSSPPQGLVAGGAAAVYREDDERIGLIQAAGDPDGLRELVGVLRRRGAVSAVNYPSDAASTRALHDAGAEVALRQLEMARAV